MRAATTREHPVVALSAPSLHLRQCSVVQAANSWRLARQRRSKQAAAVLAIILFVLHVFNSTLFFFLSMLTGLGRTKGKKKENRKYTHTKTHAQIRPTRARPMFIRIAELEPMQRAGGGVTAAWRRHFHSSRNASTRRALHTQSVQQSPASWASSQSPMTKCA